MLYATTRRFLEVFELNKLEELPTLRDLQELFPEGGLPESDASAEANATTAAEANATAGTDCGSDSDEASKSVASAPTEPASDASSAVSFAE